MNAYEAKQEARRERLEARAARLAREASGAFKRADMREEASGIPFGQPILVGHHSEGRHRAAIKRAHAAMDRGVALSKAADEAAARAESVGSGGISSDDPDAIAKLKEKLAGLEELHARELAHNKEARRNPNVRPLIPAYRFSNRSANIRNVKERIARLERDQLRQPAAPIEAAGGVRVVQNVEANRVQIIFPGKPDAAVRAILKGRGFRWAPSESAWQRQLNNSGIFAAECVLREINA
jgi:hypothetical protein